MPQHDKSDIDEFMGNSDSHSSSVGTKDDIDAFMNEAAPMVTHPDQISMNPIEQAHAAGTAPLTKAARQSHLDSLDPQERYIQSLPVAQQVAARKRIAAGTSMAIPEAVLTAGALGPVGAVSREGVVGAAKQIGTTMARGVGGTVAGSKGGAYVGKHIGKMVGYPDEGEQIGSTLGGVVGGVAALRNPEYLAKLPYGMGRMFMSNAEYEAAIAAQKVAQMKAETTAGIPHPPASGLPPEGSVVHIPEPTQGDPRWVASVPRERLAPMAQRGHEGAGEQLHNLGYPVLIEPPSGYPAPKSVQSFPLPAKAPAKLPPPPGTTPVVEQLATESPVRALGEAANALGSFTGEGLRSRFNIPESVSLQDLSDQGVIRKNGEGMWEFALTPEQQSSIAKMKQGLLDSTKMLKDVIAEASAGNPMSSGIGRLQSIRDAAKAAGADASQITEMDAKIAGLNQRASELGDVSKAPSGAERRGSRLGGMPKIEIGLDKKMGTKYAQLGEVRVYYPATMSDEEIMQTAHADISKQAAGRSVTKGMEGEGPDDYFGAEPKSTKINF